jgi:hypothetical protein
VPRSYLGEIIAGDAFSGTEGIFSWWPGHNPAMAGKIFINYRRDDSAVPILTTMRGSADQRSALKQPPV